MNRVIALAGFVLVMLGLPAFAQEIAGQWQGRLGNDDKGMRVVLQVLKTPGGDLRATLYTIDITRTPIPVEVISQGAKLSFTVPRLRISYAGEVTGDDKSIKGTWSGNTSSMPLDMVKPAKADAWVTDASPHAVSFIITSDDVELEVLDWGGTGRPLVFIPGLGTDAHVFDTFVQRFAGKYHVYGVTRRGYGASDRPEPATASYMADRLGDDVLTVIDKLKLDMPVLAGWSLGGQEMSSIASRYPERVSGLVYLDAGYAYSFYSPGNRAPPGFNLSIDANDIKAKISRLNAPDVPTDQALAIIDELLNTAVPQLHADLMTAQKATRDQPPVSTPAAPPPPETLASRISTAIRGGAQKYTKIDVPILAIFASPTAPPPNLTDATRPLYETYEAASAEQVNRFEAGLPHARVVRIPNASHTIFTSHPDDVAREMITFIDGLK